MARTEFEILGETLRLPLYSEYRLTDPNPERHTLFLLLNHLQKSSARRKRKLKLHRDVSQYLYIVRSMRINSTQYDIHVRTDDKDACAEFRNSIGEAKRGNDEQFVSAILNCIWDYNEEWELFAEPLIQPEDLPREEWLMAAIKQIHRFCAPESTPSPTPQIRDLADRVEELGPSAANIRLYLEAAQRGDSSAMNNLGYAYHHNLGIEKDYKKAFEWYLLSAQKDNCSGINNIGYCYQNGIGTDRNFDEAFRWYAKGVELADLDAMNNLGFCYQKGYGVKADLGKAFAWYYASAARGCPSGMNNLAYCYQNEWGTKQSYVDALHWYRKAAAHGNASAMHSIGHFYYHGLGVELDLREAEKWFEKARDAGSIDAVNSLGHLFEKRHLKKRG